MIEVEVQLKFMKYVRSRYEITDYVSHLLRILKCDLNTIGVGPCRRFKYNGLRVYFVCDKRLTLAVESRDTLVLFNLYTSGKFDFLYKGPPLVNQEGDMLKVVMIIVNYATLLDVVTNESSFPEIHWSERRPFDFEKLVQTAYEETNTRQDEIYRLMIRKFKPISQTKRYVLDREACASHNTLVELLFRSLAFKAGWEVKNVGEVIGVLLSYPLKHIPVASASLSSRDAAQQTLTAYGALLY